MALRLTVANTKLLMIELLAITVVVDGSPIPRVDPIHPLQIFILCQTHELGMYGCQALERDLVSRHNRNSIVFFGCELLDKFKFVSVENIVEWRLACRAG